MPPRTARAPIRPPTPSQVARQTAPFHPSPDTTTFKDLLLFEERLKMNAAMLRRRKRRYEAFLVSLVLFVIFLAHRIMLEPSELPLIRYITQGLLAVGLSTLVLFFASGMYQERIRYANRYVPHANRALRSINMHLNMRQPPRTIRSTLRHLPFSHWFISTVPASSGQNTTGPGTGMTSTKPLISPTSSVSSTDSFKTRTGGLGSNATAGTGTGTGSTTIIPTIPPTMNPRGELIFSSRVDKQFKEGYERYRAAFERRREEKMREGRGAGGVGRWLMPWRKEEVGVNGNGNGNGNGNRLRSASPMLSDGSRRGSVDKTGLGSGSQNGGRNTTQERLGVKRISTPPMGNGVGRSTRSGSGLGSVSTDGMAGNGTAVGRTSSRESSADRDRDVNGVISLNDTEGSQSSAGGKTSDSPGHRMTTRRSSALANASPTRQDRATAISTPSLNGNDRATMGARARAESYSFILGKDDPGSGTTSGVADSGTGGSRRKGGGGDDSGSGSGSGDDDRLEFIKE